MTLSIVIDVNLSPEWALIVYDQRHSRVRLLPF